MNRKQHVGKPSLCLELLFALMPAWAILAVACAGCWLRCAGNSREPGAPADSSSVARDEPNAAGQSNGGQYARFALIVDGYRFDGRPDPWTGKLVAELRRQGVTCAVVDWSSVSNDATPGYTSAVGEAAFARLAWSLLESDVPLEIHLIGYSRGAVVVCEAHRRLAWHLDREPAVRQKAAGIHVTLLDPHACNAQADFFAADELHAGLARRFNAAVDDPQPLISACDSLRVFFQRTRQTLAHMPVNPWGLQLHELAEAGRGEEFDLTAAELVIEAPKGESGGLTVCHQNLPLWYVQHVAAHGLRGGESSNAARDNPPSTAPELLCNGDFRFQGRVKDAVFRLFTDSDRIPGWKANRGVILSPHGRLLLTAGTAGDSAPSLLTSQPIYLPPQAASAQIAAFRRNGTPKIAVYQIPFSLDTAGNLAPVSERERWHRLGELRSSRVGDELLLTAPLQIHPTAGSVVGLCLEVTGDLQDVAELAKIQLAIEGADEPTASELSGQ